MNENAMPHAGPDRQGLEDAFRLFNQLSQQLTDSYQQLEGRVAELNAELAAARDARMRELTEKERLAARLEGLLQALPGGVVVLDGEGVVQECNPAAVDLLGEPLRHRAWSEIIARTFAPRADDGHEISLADGRRVNLSTCPLGDEPGQIILITDVTEMRRLQDRLHHQQRLAAMGETAASLAHQIRTPLASALLHAGQLKRPRLADADRLRIAERIFERLRHLEQLINNMLLYARGGETGDARFTTDDLFDELAQTLDAQLQSARIELIIEKAESPLPLQGNRQMLLSALLNLCMNAIQAMGRDGCLRLRAREDGEAVCLQVIDNGPGIPPEQQAAVFDPFFTTRPEGTGLGLAVVAAVVRNHQGRIELDSAPGQGCTFSLFLPRCQTRNLPDADAAPVDISIAG